MITHRRIQTGITGLDNCIEGGLPQGSITVLAGSPGTGKTILSATYLNYGALVNEKGLYVSIGEGKDRFTVNMGLLGIDFEHHEKSEQIQIMDFLTVKGPGVDAILEMITERIADQGIERLIIDSYSALACAMEDTLESRVNLHLMSRVLSASNCTTILVVETPLGMNTIGTGVEEFVADGLILLKTDKDLHRRMEIHKMRGTDVTNPVQEYTLQGGFKLVTNESGE